MYKLISYKHVQSTVCMINTMRYLAKPLKMAAVTSGIFAANIGRRRINTSAIVCEKFEFTKENKLRIDALLSFYPKEERRSALVPMFELAQRQHGWLPMSAIQKIAELLQLDPFAVFETAHFYFWLRQKPSGKYRIHVCMTTPCLLRGADKILATCEKELGIKNGETSKDMNFTLNDGVCFGACVNAPLISVNDDFYEDLTEKDITEIIGQLKKDVVLPAGPRSGRFASEPRKGLTTLKSKPTPAGYKMQKLGGDDDKC